MRPEDIQDALGNVGDDIINESAQAKKKSRKKLTLTAFIAAILAVALCVGAVFYTKGSPDPKPQKDNTAVLQNTSADKSYTSASTAKKNLTLCIEPTYPVWPKHYSVDYAAEDNINGESFDNWFDFTQQMCADYESMEIDLTDYVMRTAKTFMEKTDGENLVYSPINVYMALAMLCEVTDGNSRAQILEILECENIEEVRSTANAIWRANYRNDGVVTTLMANSFWVGDYYSYNEDTLNNLSEHYYAGFFAGHMGSEDMNQALRSWINENTGGLLEEYSKELKFNEDTVLALASTLYFKCKWSDEFNERNTEEGVFSSPEGEITCDFMNQYDSGTYFYGDNFSCVAQSIEEGGAMYFFLPDEGVSPEELVCDSQIYELLSSPYDWQGQKYLMIDRYIPKFDVSSDLTLDNYFKALGITDVYDYRISDFTPLTEDTSVYVSESKHAARVKIDEEGCEAAAYTVIMADAGAAMPPDEEVEFRLDRPFLFVITSRVGTPLFMGVVNQPIE